MTSTMTVFSAVVFLLCVGVAAGLWLAWIDSQHRF